MDLNIKFKKNFKQQTNKQTTSRMFIKFELRTLIKK